MNGGKDMKVSTWHLRGAVGALSILVVGFLLGMVTDRVVVAHEGGVGLHTVATGAIHEEAMVSFREVLDLEDHQLQQIHEILMRSQGQVDGAWAELREEIHTSIQGVHDEIRGILNEEQQALFEEWLHRHVMTDPNGEPILRWAH